VAEKFRGHLELDPRSDAQHAGEVRHGQVAGIRIHLKRVVPRVKPQGPAERGPDFHELPHCITAGKARSPESRKRLLRGNELSCGYPDRNGHSGTTDGTHDRVEVVARRVEFSVESRDWDVAEVLVGHFIRVRSRVLTS